MTIDPRFTVQVSLLDAGEPCGPFYGVAVCLFCGSGEDVICYPGPRSVPNPAVDLTKQALGIVCIEERILLPNETRPTACPTCCGMQEDGHEYSYDRAERKDTCDRCGQDAPDDHYDFCDGW